MVVEDPRSVDTKFNENERDWIEVYRHEIKVAVDNEDKDAYDFFFEEYMRERIRHFKEQRSDVE